MKKYRVLAAMAAVMIMAAGCGSSAEEEAVTGISFEPIPQEELQQQAASEEQSEAAMAATVEATVEEAVDEDVPPQEGMVRSYFTNEWTTPEIQSARPLAVMYPINKKAQPQYGLNKVSVFYEIMEEGDMSRQMGILEDWEDLGRIGNIRSIRDYFVYAALEYDPVIIHFGGPELYVKDILTRSDVDNLNGVGGVMGPDYGAFYRVPAGSTSEHTAFTDGAHVAKGIEKAKFSKEHRADYFHAEPHFNFASYSDPETLDGYGDAARSVSKIDMAGCYPVTKSALSYNADDKLYYKTLYGNAQCDAVTGTQLAFRNVIVQRTLHDVRDAKGYLSFQMKDSTRDGYYFTNGKMIHITWSKTEDYGPTRYYDDNGNEIRVNSGKTMIFVIEEGDSFKVDGDTIAP